MTPLPEPEVKSLRLPPDPLARRLGWAVLVSVLVNLVLWQIVSGAVRRANIAPPVPVEITRILLPPVVRRFPTPPRKIAPKKAVPRRPQPKPLAPPRPVITHSPIPKPKITERPKRQVTPKIVARPLPVLPPKRTVRRIVTPPPVPAPRPVAAPTPSAPHHNVLTAREPAAKPQEFTMPRGGEATVGKPVEHQGPSNAVDNTPKPTARQEVAPSPRQEPQRTPVSEARQESQRGSEASGPTQEAEPVNQVKPEIPEELKQGSLKTFVRVKVDIEANGRFTVTLRTSSGNAEIDRRVLGALNRWKWKPALQNGKPVQSTQRFKFEFEVN